jgi:hypothetical protein
MKIIYQKNNACTVNRERDDLVAEYVLVSTLQEARAEITVDVEKFAIKSARWDVFRLPEGYTALGSDIPELIGLEAFFQAGAGIRQAIGDEMNGLIQALVNECVKGLIQAETYVYGERGYSSASEYDRHWETFDPEYCRYYKNIDRIAMHWSEYLGGCRRERNLFHRNRQCTVYRQAEGMVLNGSFIDSFHEFGLMMRLNLQGEIADCRGDFLRAPDRICFENSEHLQRLKGKNLSGVTKRLLGQDLGGPQGCFHLVDMAYELAQALKESNEAGNGMT